MRFAIIGAGVSGLSLGYFLKKQGHHVDVFEREPIAGGVAGSVRWNGFVVEKGPNSLLDAEPAFVELIQELGLSVVEANVESKKRFLYLNGELQQIPMSPGGLFSSKLLSWSDKWKLISERFRSHDHSPPEETVYEFAARHFGAAVAERLALPMVVGVFGGDARKLKIADAFPKVVQLEKEHGSLIKAMAASGSGKRTKLITFPGGVQDLIDALSAKLGPSLRLGERVMGMSPTKQVRTPKRFDQYDQVIFASGWPALQQIQTAASADPALATLAKVVAPVVSLSLALEGPSPIQGFGALIHPESQLKTLGVLCPSQIFKGRAPEGKSLLTLIMGGTFHPELAMRPESEILNHAMSDLRKIFGSVPQVSKHWCFRWHEGITQYEVSVSQLRSSLVERVRQDVGLIIHSHGDGGVSVPDCIRKSKELAEALSGKSHV